MLSYSGLSFLWYFGRQRSHHSKRPLVAIQLLLEAFFVPSELKGEQELSVYGWSPHGDQHNGSRFRCPHSKANPGDVSELVLSIQGTFLQAHEPLRVSPRNRV